MNAPTAVHASPESISRLAGAPMSFKIAARAALHLKHGKLTAVLPDGRRLVFGDGRDGPEATMIVRNWKFARRLLAAGNLGFAEGYIAGDWDTPDLAAVLELFSSNLDPVLHDLGHNPVIKLMHRLYHALRSNTKAGARKNIYAHYDLGNDFYALWLDPTMTYSSALYARPGEPLEAAQINKYRALADHLGLKEGQHVLEIGSGWGGFAEYAAKERGARVTGITISQEQFDFARKRMFDRQLADKVDIKLVDYRDIEGEFDSVASIEMFEAVGQEYWPSYFGKIADVLRPGGAAGLQIITIQDALFDRYSKSVDFIQRYVFPGGMLPSVTRLKSEVDDAGLAWREMSAFGQHYADTLAEWGVRFTAAWDDIQKLSDNFDERFKRLWLYYLAYCEAGFRTRRIDVAQFTLAKT